MIAILTRRVAALAALATFALAVLVVVVTAPVARAAEPSEWTLDAGKSRVTFTGRQMGAPSTGRFETFSATIRFDPGNPGASRVEVSIDAKSATTGNPDIDRALKGPKWLAVEEFPAARFVASAFRALGDGAYEVDGALTIRGVTKNVTVPFKVAIAEEGGRQVATATGELGIKRLDYGIGTGEWGDTNIVADAVAIRFEIVGHRPK